MNKVEIIEGGHYKCHDFTFGVRSRFTVSIYIKKLRKIEVKSFWGKKSIVDGIVYSEFDDGSFESIMSLDKFNKKVLYKV